MPLTIKNSRVEMLARQLASRTGESLTEVVLKSLEARLAALPSPQQPDEMAAALRQLASFRLLPVTDPRDSSQLFAELYGDDGAPH